MLVLLLPGYHKVQQARNRQLVSRVQNKSTFMYLLCVSVCLSTGSTVLVLRWLPCRRTGIRDRLPSRRRAAETTGTERNTVNVGFSSTEREMFLPVA